MMKSVIALVLAFACSTAAFAAPEIAPAPTLIKPGTSAPAPTTIKPEAIAPAPRTVMPEATAPAPNQVAPFPPRHELAPASPQDPRAGAVIPQDPNAGKVNLPRPDVAAAACETSCSGAVAKLKFVDAKGACKLTFTSPCYPYACNAKGTSCNTSCLSSSECAVGSVCNPDTKQCAPLQYNCSDDGKSIVSTNGSSQSCAPYMCRAGQCLQFCATTLDCEGGRVCHPVSRSCVTPDSGYED